MIYCLDKFSSRLLSGADEGSFSDLSEWDCETWKCSVVTHLTSNIYHPIFGKHNEDFMKREFSNFFCNHCWNFSVDILWCHLTSLLQINAAASFFTKRRIPVLTFLCWWTVPRASAWPLARIYVWTLTNECLSDCSFLFDRGWGLRNLRNLSTCLLSNPEQASRKHFQPSYFFISEFKIFPQ